jgi:hypothetical protein
MRAKLIFSILFIAVSSFAFGQTTLAQKDSAAKNLAPIAGKAIVHIIRPTSYGFLIKMNVECDSVHIGSTKAKKYIYTVLDPGRHTFVSKSENHYKFDLDVEAGKIYYIKQQVEMGALYAETGLEILSDQDGKKYLDKCTLSKDNVYSDK